MRWAEGVSFVSIMSSKKLSLPNGPGLKSKKVIFNIFKTPRIRCNLTSSISVSMVRKIESTSTMCRGTDVVLFSATLRCAEIVAVPTIVLNETKVASWWRWHQELLRNSDCRSTLQYGTVTPPDRGVVKTCFMKMFQPQGWSQDFLRTTNLAYGL